MANPVKPSKDCTLTREVLQKDRKKLNDFCDKCKRRGFDCYVDEHPSERDLAGNKTDYFNSFI